MNLKKIYWNFGISLNLGAEQVVDSQLIFIKIDVPNRFVSLIVIYVIRLIAKN